MKTTIKGWLLLTAMLGGTTMAADRPARVELPADAVYRMGLSGEIVIDTDGNVTQYKIDHGDITPAIAALVGNSVKQWRFEPILVNSKPVNAKTSIRIDIEAQKDGDKYLVKVSDVAFGNPERDNRKLQPPKYPWLAQQAGIDALVVLVLRLDAEGKVVDLYPESTRLSGTGPERIVQQWRKIFEDNAMAAAKRWKFAITESFDGKPVSDSAVRIPVEYRIDGNQGQWRAMVPVGGPDRIPPWGRAWQVRQSTANLSSREAQSLTSGFKLKEPVVGNYL